MDHFYHPQRGVVIISLAVARAVYVNTITFESLDLENSLSVCGYVFRRYRSVRSLYEGNQVKVKVTCSKKRENPYLHNVKLQ